MLYGAMNFPVRPVLEELEMIAGLGFDYLELTMDPPQAHRERIREQRKRLLKALDSHHMGLICHLPTFVSTADLTPALRQASLKEVLESLEVAADLGPLKVVVHPGFIGGLGTLVMDQAKEYGMDSLEAIVRRADRLGLCLCLENMFPRNHWLADPEEFEEVFNRFSSLKLTLDTGHAHIQGQGAEKTLRFINRFSRRIGHIHASDNFGKEDNHLPVGAGTVPFPEIIEALKGIGYDETVTLEIFSSDRDYLKISRAKFAGMVAAR